MSQKILLEVELNDSWDDYGITDNINDELMLEDLWPYEWRKDGIINITLKRDYNILKQYLIAHKFSCPYNLDNICIMNELTEGNENKNCNGKCEYVDNFLNCCSKHK